MTTPIWRMGPLDQTSFRDERGVVQIRIGFARVEGATDWRGQPSAFLAAWFLRESMLRAVFDWRIL
jgi:hypothetical protein